MGTRLASFPNSRIKPRPARSAGVTVILSVPSGAPATLIVPANVDRTSVLVRNIDPATDGWYGYTAGVDGVTEGELLKAGEPVTLDDQGDIYFYQNSGAPIKISYDEGVG
jgi:hypothetical protein